MLGKGLQLKTIVVVSKVFEKLVNNRIVQYGLRSSQATADLLRVVSDRITRAFNRSRTTRAKTLDMSKVCDASLLHKLKSYGNLGQIIGLISSFLSKDTFEWFESFWMGSLHKNIQLMLEFLNAPFLVLHFSYYILTH